MKHDDCGGNVMVDVTKAYRILAKVTKDNEGQGLSTIEADVFNVDETCSELVYWCMSCDEEVDLADVTFRCQRCESTLTLASGNVPEDTGGIWCTSCAEDRCDGEDCVSLESVYETDTLRLT